jgi:lactoylglutathione lyase
MDLGEYHACLNVRDLAQSIEFYEKLGFTIIEDHRQENWAVLRHNNMVLSLFEGHIDRTLINFRGGDIEAIHEAAVRRGIQFTKPAHRESDGSWSAEVRDPDGNCIYFNTFPEERERYVRDGKLVDTGRGGCRPNDAS